MKLLILSLLFIVTIASAQFAALYQFPEINDSTIVHFCPVKNSILDSALKEYAANEWKISKALYHSEGCTKVISNLGELIVMPSLKDGQVERNLSTYSGHGSSGNLFFLPEVKVMVNWESNNLALMRVTRHYRDGLFWTTESKKGFQRTPIAWVKLPEDTLLNLSKGRVFQWAHMLQNTIIEAQNPKWNTFINKFKSNKIYTDRFEKIDNRNNNFLLQEHINLNDGKLISGRKLLVDNRIKDDFALEDCGNLCIHATDEQIDSAVLNKKNEYMVATKHGAYILFTEAATGKVLYMENRMFKSNFAKIYQKIANKKPNYQTEISGSVSFRSDENSPNLGLEMNYMLFRYGQVGMSFYLVNQNGFRMDPNVFFTLHFLAPKKNGSARFIVPLVRFYGSYYDTREFSGKYRDDNVYKHVNLPIGDGLIFGFAPGVRVRPFTIISGDFMGDLVGRYLYLDLFLGNKAMEKRFGLKYSESDAALIRFDDGNVQPTESVIFSVGISTFWE